MFKSYFKKAAFIAFGAVAAFSLTSCDDDDNGGGSTSLTAKEREMRTVAQVYVNKTVLPTYKLLAEATSGCQKQIRERSEQPYTS